MGKAVKILQINWWKFFKWNFLSSNVKRDQGKYIIPYRHAVIDIHKSGYVELHANITIAPVEVKGSKRESIIFVRENGRLIVNGKVTLQTGGTIQVQHDASIEIGRAYINHGATIIAGNHMKIGNELLCSRNVTIFDSDFHKIIDEEGNQLNTPRNIEIGDHVWIGVNATLLRGAKVGDGAVIAAGAVVGGKIKPGTMASGNPARSYSQILWEA